ncbi:hypothetical protein LX36DRAFT_692269 [Colletotrichum falcatum]|nr:hypothetical protein LX36DRAFT_692269 [Colletotrichum falcatum]
MNSTNEKALQLFYISSLFGAVNESCRKMNNITYSSGDPRAHHVPSPLQAFLCRLAQVCDSEKGGGTITALVALKAAGGPKYLLASNSRKESGYESALKFLGDLLGFVGRNPERLAEKALKKKVLWRILEFNFPRVDYYLRQIVAAVGESGMGLTAKGTDILARLRHIEANATFPRDIQSDPNARSKFLSDCVTLIKAIHHTTATGFGLVMNKGAAVDDPDVSHAWCQLRHHLGRMYSYRQAADSIVEACKEWPQLFTGFTVGHVPSSRQVRLPLPRPTLPLEDVIRAALPDWDFQAYAGHIERLREYGLEDHIRGRLEQKPVKQVVHCEVLLQDFLVQEKMTRPHNYWGNSMFIATSKPPCRLCHYYFEHSENDFLLQSPHMNVYPKWRLPDTHEGQDRDAVVRREDLLDDIIEQMQQDTLRVVREQHHEWKRNDSRTESFTGVSRYGERSDTRNSGRFSSASGISGLGMGAEGRDPGFPLHAAADNDYICVGVAN